MQIAILGVSAVVPFVLDWRSALAPLNTFMRRLIWVYGAFIVLTIIGFGAISLMHAETLAEGRPLARSFCTFIAVFWAARLLIQFLVFDIKSVTQRRLFLVGYHCLTIVFVVLVVIYGVVAMSGTPVQASGG